MSKDIEDIMRTIHNPNLVKNKINFNCEIPKIKEYVLEIITHFKKLNFEKIPTKKLSKFLFSLDKKYKFQRRPKKSNIIYILRKMFYENEILVKELIFFVELLRAKNMRSLSGIIQVAIMTHPGSFSCEYDCYYCPNQKDMPRSYIKEEPAVLRAAQNNFDTVEQIFDRVGQYIANGHYGDKGEFIILGGTWSNYSYEYQKTFMRDLYYACNIFFDRKRTERYSLEKEKTINESALFKVVGLTIETRPDMITPEEIKRYVEYGVTRVQIGVQTIHDHLLKKINRQCYSIDTKRALYLLKNAGFKILCHFMPNLPGSTPDLDIEMFDTIINNPNFDCDEWKLYPTSITTTSDKDIEDVNTVIEKWYLDGKYVPYSNECLKDVLKYAMKNIKNHKRISRIFRDIPVNNIIGGARTPHLRQVLENELAKEGKYCKCIKSREIKNREFDIKNVFYKVEKYEASYGTEYFISANVGKDENTKMSYLIGFCRLRIRNNTKVDVDFTKDHNNTNFINVLKNCALIREMHVYGLMVPSYLSKIEKSNSQHRGIGGSMLRIAEGISVKEGFNKMAIISGVGVRGFYRKNGYKLEENYMTKILTYNILNYITPFMIEVFMLVVVILYSYLYN
jgi:ELP3 family radical SAM enzyme/protein acetyltransferase